MKYLLSVFTLINYNYVLVESAICKIKEPEKYLQTVLEENCALKELLLKQKADYRSALLMLSDQVTKLNNLVLGPTSNNPLPEYKLRDEKLCKLSSFLKIYSFATTILTVSFATIYFFGPRPEFFKQLFLRLRYQPYHF